MESYPPVSIIIPVYNGARTIEKSLRAALKQSYPGPVEVIVVDDGSTDETMRIVRGFPSVRYIRQDNSGPASARNRGAEEASGEWLFFTDADCVPFSDWIERACRYFKDGSIAVVAGTYAVANPERLLARCIQREIAYRHGRFASDSPKSFGSYNFGVRKKVFDRLGGFDPGYREASGEDNDLSYRIIKDGCRIRFEPESKVQHYHIVSALRYFRDQLRHGYWRAKLYRDHPDMGRGDDYTFWKDIVEPPLVYGIIVTALSGIWEVRVRAVAPVLSAALVLIQIRFSILFLTSFQEKVYFTGIMTVRAFARAFGFIAGLARFFVLSAVPSQKHHS